MQRNVYNYERIYDRLINYFFNVPLLIVVRMFVCSNCVIRLSPLVSKYFGRYSLSNLASKPWLFLSGGLANPIRTHFSNSSNVKTLKSAAGTLYLLMIILVLIIFCSSFLKFTYKFISYIE